MGAFREPEKDTIMTNNQPSLIPLFDPDPFDLALNHPTMDTGNRNAATPVNESAHQYTETHELLSVLRGAGWRKAPELERVLGVDARTVRGMAAAAAGRVISGQKGYHLTAEADPDDVRHAVARLRSQAAEMNRRARLTEVEQARPVRIVGRALSL
jgi:hypothetical protein